MKYKGLYLKKFLRDLTPFGRVIKEKLNAHVCLILCNILLFSSIGALVMQMSVCLSVGICLLSFCHNSVNFHARTSRFCMKVDLDNIKQIMMMIMMIMMMIMIMIMMIKIIIDVTQSILKLGPPDFACN